MSAATTRLPADVRIVLDGLAAWCVLRGACYLGSAAFGVDLFAESSQVYEFMALLPAWAWGIALVVPGLALAVTPPRRYAAHVLALAAGMVAALHLPIASLLMIGNPFSPAWVASSIALAGALYATIRIWSMRDRSSAEVA